MLRMTVRLIYNTQFSFFCPCIYALQGALLWEYHCVDRQEFQEFNFKIIIIIIKWLYLHLSMDVISTQDANWGDTIQIELEFGNIVAFLGSLTGQGRPNIYSIWPVCCFFFSVVWCADCPALSVYFCCILYRFNHLECCVPPTRYYVSIPHKLELRPCHSLLYLLCHSDGYPFQNWVPTATKYGTKGSK